MTSPTESSPWTGDRLRLLLFSWWLWDGNPRRVAELLNDDDNLPPLNEDTVFVSVSGEALYDWKDEERPRYQRGATNLLREGRKEARLQKEKWEADLEELEELGRAVQRAERDVGEKVKRCRAWIGRQITGGTLYAGAQGLPAKSELLDLRSPKWLFPKGALLTELMRVRKLKADWAELYRLQRRLMRVECQQEFRLEVLGEALRGFRNEGRVARSSVATETRSEHERRVLEYFDEVPFIGGRNAAGYAVKARDSMVESPGISTFDALGVAMSDGNSNNGRSKVDTIQRNNGYQDLPTDVKRTNGFRVFKALVFVQVERRESGIA